MYFKVEKTGCSVRRGRVQVRYCLYLDFDDYGYEKHYIDVPDYDIKNYTGEIKDGKPVDIEAFSDWVKTQPTKKQLNPFHNHFVQLEPTVIDAEILYIGEVACIECKRLWDKDIDLGNSKTTFKNEPLATIHPYVLTQDRFAECESKLLDIQSKTLEKMDVVDIWAQ